jgi:hypothetical protein
MPSGTFKLVYGWQQPNKSWSEIWYVTTSSLYYCANTIAIDPALLQAMVAFRPPVSLLYNVRISSVSQNRQSLIKYINMKGGTGVYQDPDVCGASALYRFNASVTAASRAIWFRGLPDAFVTRDPNTGQDKEDASLKIAVNNYLTQIKRWTFQIRSQIPLPVPPVDPNKDYAVQTIAAGAISGQTALTTPMGSNFQVDTLVKIHLANPKDFPGLNGIWQVLTSAAGGTSITIPYQFPIGGAGPIGRMKIRPIAYQYGNVDDNTTNFIGYNTRKTGKNRWGGRGARSAVRLRHSL